MAQRGRHDYGIAVDRRPVGLFHGSQPGGDPGFAGGDGLAVAPAVGAFGQVLTVLLDFADVGFTIAGVKPPP